MLDDRELEMRLRGVARTFVRAFPPRPELSKLILLRLGREPQLARSGDRHMVAELGLTALLLIGVAALSIATLHARGIPATRSQPAASVQPQATPLPHASLPDQDLVTAGLTNVAALITPENQPGRSGGQGVTLIGAYADPARTVLFFRLGPYAVLPGLSIYDSEGFLNASTSGGPGVAGDAVFGLDTGPHVSADGLAHLTVTMGSMPDFPGKPTGPGAFSIAVKVQSATAFQRLAPFPLGSWTVTVEKLEATPAVIHLRAVLAGATPDAIQMSTATLLDATGTPLRQIAESAGVTVPKQQLNASNYANTRVDYQWMRPAAGGTYQLQLRGPGGSRTIILNLGGL